MMSKQEKEDEKKLTAFLHHVGIDPEGDQMGTLMELMNFSLQCIGAVRILAMKIEKARRVAWTTSIDKQIDYERVGFAQWSLRKVFSFAAKRILNHVVDAEQVHNLDPSRHIIESFPAVSAVVSHNWLAAHWAILGDPDKHDFTAKPHPEHDPEHEEEEAADDERLCLLDCLVPYQPSTVREVDSEGRTVLHIAARLHSVPLFHSVLALCGRFNGCTLATANLNGALPLHNAARFNRSEQVFSSVAQAYPAALTAENNDGMLPLHWAAAKGRSVAIIRSLLAAHPLAVTTANWEGYLPLHCACQNDALDVVRLIFEANPDAIKVRDTDGGLPLHHACCMTDEVQVVRFLHEAYDKAMAIAQEHGGCTPLHLAASVGSRPDIIRYILSVCPGAAAVKDGTGWCAAHCLLKEATAWNDRRLDCLRLILRANPRVEGAYELSLCDAAARLVLRQQRDQDLDRFHALNWRARMTIVQLIVHLAHDPGTQGGDGYNRSYRRMQLLLLQGGAVRGDVLERLVADDRNRMTVLRRLVDRFMSPACTQIPSGVLRKIVSFL